MKYLSHILALAILIATTAPCADGDESANDSQEFCEKDSDQPSEEHQDLCSPFCTCNCCQTSFADEFLYVLEFQLFTILVSEKTDFLDSRISFSIWEPPPLYELTYRI